ncbi:MAG: ABC transporter ATP-binding protein [Planctomycetota bacterium]|nr:MAG: ABC transporter ATP-binding protein [Planctomycetota bacterium]
MSLSAELVIETANVSKSYRRGFWGKNSFTALNDVSLQVPRGEIYGLLGPNGAGKTTLIKILLGIIRKSAGNATVLGHAAGSMEARRRIGYLPENHRIPRHLTALTALEYYGSLSGMSMSAIRAERMKLLEVVGLRGRERERVSGYSKGMLQRLGLAQAMLHRPDLIVLDEPTDGVDPVGRREIRDVLKQLADQGHSIFLNSHLLQEIELICSSVAILNHGKLLKTGSVRELTAALADAPVQMQLTGDEAVVRRIADQYSGSKLRVVTSGAYELEVRIPKQADLDIVVDALRQAGVSIWRLARKEQTLEEVFIGIVGGAV